MLHVTVPGRGGGPKGRSLHARKVISIRRLFGTILAGVFHFAATLTCSIGEFSTTGLFSSKPATAAAHIWRAALRIFEFPVLTVARAANIFREDGNWPLFLMIANSLLMGLVLFGIFNALRSRRRARSAKEII